MALEELNTSENRKRALRREIKAAVAALDKGYTKEADLQIFRHVAVCRNMNRRAPCSALWEPAVRLIQRPYWRMP